MAFFFLGKWVVCVFKGMKKTLNPFFLFLLLIKQKYLSRWIDITFESFSPLLQPLDLFIPHSPRHFLFPFFFLILIGLFHFSICVERRRRLYFSLLPKGFFFFFYFLCLDFFLSTHLFRFNMYNFRVRPPPEKNDFFIYDWRKMIEINKK